jgi:uncharacterized membrane-anchored protein YhcB (DUF1043 family)
VTPTFVLDTSILVGAATVVGSVIGFLFRALMAAKDAQIAAQQVDMEKQRTILLAEITALKIDRDFWRDRALSGTTRAGPG